jgi:heme oxygenase
MSNPMTRVLNLADALAGDTIAEVLPEVSVLQELKQKTAAHHRALEETAGIWDGLTSEPLYATLLIRFWGVYSAGESRLAALEELPRWLPDLSQRWKLSALESDLMDLGIPSESWGSRTSEPEIPTVAAAFGWLYVFEGSTLGGRMIARQVNKTLGLGPQNGCHFFSSYGTEVTPMWKRFGESLESFCRSNPDCRDEVIQNAELAFGFFARALSSR